jgi:bifunctional N-acetylglucosamine-1-phosphate-uridyltransferase/glucosamine-1-phosphate-acetyltransferase GlmU-like protein
MAPAWNTMTDRAGPSACCMVVRAAGDGTVVEALDPRVIAAVAGQPELTEIAEDAAARLRAALDALPPA